MLVIFDQTFDPKVFRHHATHLLKRLVRLAYDPIQLCMPPALIHCVGVGRACRQKMQWHVAAVLPDLLADAGGAVLRRVAKDHRTLPDLARIFQVHDESVCVKPAVRHEPLPVPVDRPRRDIPPSATARITARPAAALVIRGRRAAPILKRGLARAARQRSAPLGKARLHRDRDQDFAAEPRRPDRTRCLTL